MMRGTSTAVLVTGAAMIATSVFALGVQDGRLAPCPDSPNCVSSDAPDESHHIEAFPLAAPPAQAWSELEAVLKDTPRVSIIQLSSDYLHAEFKSAVFRFVDDVEFHLRPTEDLIAVRSASRTGYYDFGANRSRIEDLRGKLRERGVVR
jgi:uncharacterized protein (DUF1499 family)